MSNKNKIETYTGKFVNPLILHIQDINIEDIAHSLSNLCRFNGHCSQFYSVAEHCCLAFDLADYLMYGSFCMRDVLLHDMVEAYIGDLPRPIKNQVYDYGQHEKVLYRLMSKIFRTSYPIPDYVKYIDNVMLASEAKVLMKSQGQNWQLQEQPNEYAMMHIQCWNPQKAEKEFLRRFDMVNL